MSGALAIKYVSPEILKPHPENPRVHPESAITKLTRSVEEFGWTSPILVTRDFTILAGHARLKAAQKANVKKIPVIVLPLTGAKAKAYLIADNKLQEETTWDNTILRNLLMTIDTGEIDMELTGFSSKEIEALITGVSEASEDAIAVSGEQEGAFALKPDMVFKSGAPYNIPELRMDMLTECPEPIATWSGPDASTPKGFEWYFYNHGSDSIRGLDLKKTVYGFYVDDYRFEPLWDRPDDYTGRILNRKIPICVTPNFSVLVDMPEAAQIWNSYRARWVGRYFQEAGLKIIPDVLLPMEPKQEEWMFAGIPKGAPCLSVEIQHGGRDPDGGRDIPKLTVRALKIVLERLEPRSLLVYLGKEGDELVEAAVPPGFKTVRIASRVSQRAPIMRKEK